jgi:hypothetical protein
MSAEKSIGYKQLAIESAAAGIGSGIGGVMGITAYDHRDLTHGSLKVNKFLKKAFDFEKRTLGIGDATIWASVHRIHHSITDVSLLPFYEISRATKWVEDNPDKAAGITIPESFAKLDPFVIDFTRDEVMKIGDMAEGLVKDRLGEAYETKADYTVEKVKELLNPDPEIARYFYSKNKKHKGEWEQDQIAEILLTDPHSPALIDRENGVRGIALKNVPLYRHAAKLFFDRPDLKPKDLQSEDGKNNEESKLDIVAGVALPAAGVLFRRGEYKPKDFAIAAVAGSAIYGFRAATEIVGGNVTNSLGHAGVFDLSRLTQAAFRKNYEFTLNKDGSLATDTRHAGFWGKVLGIVTLDEVGGQQVHHAYPNKVAYTMEEGLKGFAEAPWGTTLEKIADSKLPFIERGDNFGGGPRPDVPHDAVIAIQNIRMNPNRRKPGVRIAA